MRKKRIIAIDPTHRGFGYAVFEGLDSLINWGVAHVGMSDNKACLKRIRVFFSEYEPDILVLEDPAGRGSRRCERVKRLLAQTELYAKAKGIKVQRFSRAQIRAAFQKPRRPNKEEIAKDIAERFPELSSRVPPERKPWMSEAAGMNIFDAVSLCITFYQSIEKRKRRLKGRP